MRRHATMGLAFVLPLAFSFLAFAQTKGAPAKKGGAKAAPAASASAAPAPASSAADAPAPAAAASASDTSAAPPPPASSAAAATTGAPYVPGKIGVDGATYAVRLRDVESRVDELKDQIRRSHTRLSLLSDTIVAGGIGGSRVEILFANEMSDAFRLASASFVIDGAVQYNRQDDSGVLANMKEIPVFSGSVPPGDHKIEVGLSYQGNGYGVFTYLKGYRFDVKSSHTFTVDEGKSLSVTAAAIERGGLLTPMEERPAIEWREKAATLGTQTGAQTPAGPPPTTQAPGTKDGTGTVGGGKP